MCGGTIPLVEGRRLNDNAPVMEDAGEHRDTQPSLVGIAPTGALRPSRGFVTGLILSAPLWVILTLIARNVLSWIR